MNDFAKNGAMVAERLSQVKVVPVLILHSEEKALKLAEILVKHGLQAAEITFRTKEAGSILASLSKHFPELFLGAGTILNVADLHRAFDNGAHFAVAPGLNIRVVKGAIEAGYPFAPGICTPSELELACELGCRFLKFFPAEAIGGVKMLKAMASPYKHLNLRYMPTGGITRETVADYLAIKEVAAVGGTWLGKEADIENGEWDKIEAAVAKEAQFIANYKQSVFPCLYGISL